MDASALYELIAIRDVQDAADALHGVYEETGQRDGYVSLDVSPFLAYDTAATLTEARRLWRAVERENLMIKVPATTQGIAAIRPLIADGINVNATLLFGQEPYERTAQAYLAGLEDLAARGGALERVASVASFFVSRIDQSIEALVASRLELPIPLPPIARCARSTARWRLPTPSSPTRPTRTSSPARGGRRWRAGARGRSGCCGPARAPRTRSSRDIRYVEELVGPDTVTTLPPATLDAFRDHGRPRASLTEDVDAARDTMAAFAESGIPYRDLTERLLAEGVDLSSAAFGKLLKAIDGAEKGRGQGPDQSADLQPAGAVPGGRRTDARGVGSRSQGAAALGPRRVALDRQGRGTVARMARHRAGPARRHPPVHAARGAGEDRRLCRCPAPRHGRVEPVPRGAEVDLRQDRRISRAPRPRLDRSRAGEDVRAQRRSRAHALHRVEQVGLHARAEHLQGLLLRSARAARRPAAGRPPFHRDHRSRLLPPAGRRTRRLPAGLLRRGRRSAAASRRSRTSAWCRPRSWAWMSRSSSTAPRR